MSTNNNIAIAPVTSLKSLAKSGFATAKGNYFHVRPEAIVIDPSYNARKDYGDMDELKRQIVAVGRIKEPLTVEFKDGALSLIEGHRRLRAVAELNADGQTVISSVPILIEAMNEVEKIVDLVVSNDGKNFNMLEQGIVFKRLKDAGLKGKEIAEKVGKTQAHVSNCLKLANAPEEIQEQINTGSLSSANALDVIRENKGNIEEAVKAVEEAVQSAKAEGKTKATQKTMAKDKAAKAPKKVNGTAPKSTTDVEDTEAVEIPLRVFKAVHAALSALVTSNKITEVEGNIVTSHVFNLLSADDKSVFEVVEEASQLKVVEDLATV